MKRLNKVHEAGENPRSSFAEVGDLMTDRVISVSRHQTVEHARELLGRHGIHAVPVVSADGEAVGVLTTTDLVDDPAPETLIGKVMTRDVYTISRYSGVHLAARMMRNHRIHHLIVTHEQKVVGIVSSFDLLQLVEDRRFVARRKPSTPRKGGGRRRKREDTPQD